MYVVLCWKKFFFRSFLVFLDKSRSMTLKKKLIGHVVNSGLEKLGLAFLFCRKGERGYEEKTAVNN